MPQDRIPIEAGPGSFAACAGDFGQDGLPDVFIAGDARNRLYHNRAGGGWNYEEVLQWSGEVEYISRGGGIAVQAADVTGDGLQDLFIAYGTRMAPHILFNLGSRCFQHARELDLSEQRGAIEKTDANLVDHAGQGQQAGYLGDFNGDGALDMALVLGNGDVCVFPRKVSPDSPAKGIAVSLSPGAERAGPVAVTVAAERRSLGCWTVPAGGGPVLIGARQAGPVQLQWRWPGGEIQTRRVKVKESVVPVDLGRP